MPDDPKPFTDTQRALFSRVAALNRAEGDTFGEADRWIDTAPPSAQADYGRFRDDQLTDARERRRRGDRSYRIDLSRPETGYGVVTYRRPGWQQMPDEQRRQVLRDARTYYGQNLRYQRQGLADRIREEAERGPLQPHQLIEIAASRFTRSDEPLVFDAMNPQQKTQWARRLLRVVWILTDTAELTTTKLDWLRDWSWGEHALEFLAPLTGGKPRPIPRLWSRVTILDRELDEWERLTIHALRALEEAEPGSTVIAATTSCIPRSVDERSQQTREAPSEPAAGTVERQRTRRGRLAKEESEAKRAQMLAIIGQHSSLKDDPAKLAADVGVSESTIRRWLDDAEQIYRNSRAARGTSTEE